MSTFIAIDSYDANDIAAISSYLEANAYPYLQSKGFTMMSFSGPLARRDYVAPAATDPGVKLLTGAGHGTYASFTGFQGESVFSTEIPYSADEVRGKIAHFLSCENAKQLGPDFVKNGCLAYIGYDENFAFDPVFGDIFFKCDSEIIRGLADGLTIGNAVTQAKALFAQTIADLKAQGTAEAAEAAARLQYNLLHLRSPLDGPQWGSADAKLA
jgi:hypothetical protein